MVSGPKELKPIAVFAALTAGAGVLMLVISAMNPEHRLLTPGMICLAAGALAFLAWALSTAGELRRRVLERVEGRPELTDGEFAARFFPEIPAKHDDVARIRRTIAKRFSHVGGAGYWPEDRLVEDLHLTELAPAELADLPEVLRRELRLSPERWDGEARWVSVEDVYLSALGAMGEPPDDSWVGNPK